jgi:predicted Zn-dependent peptidase
MGFLLDHIDQRKLDAQRLIIAREREERSLGLSSRNTQALVVRALYGTTHPYRLSIEQPNDAMSLSLDHVRWFHQRWYVPSNATLVVVGDFETAQARRWIERYFGTLARVARPGRAQDLVQPLSGERSIVTRGARFEEQLVLNWNTPPLGAEDDAELDLISDVLTGSVVARLTDRVTRAQPVALGIDSEQHSEALGSLFYLSAIAIDRRPAELLLPHIDAELERIRTKRFRSTSFEACRRSGCSR